MSDRPDTQTIRDGISPERIAEMATSDLGRRLVLAAGLMDRANRGHTADLYREAAAALAASEQARKQAEQALRRLWEYEPEDTEASADEWGEIQAEVAAALAVPGEDTPAE